jgi:beta-galactosidase
MYDLCDEMGFLVMDEAFDEWEAGKNKWIEGWNVGTPGKDGYHEHFSEWAERDLRDMILRNRNRPSIVMWSIGNEIDYPNDPYTHEVLNTGRNPQIYGKGHLPDHPPVSRLGEISKRLAAIVRETDSTRPVTAALAGVVMSNTTSYPDNIDLVGYNYQEYRYEADHKEYPNRIIYGSENGKNTSAWTAVDTSKNIFAQFLWTAFDFMGEARAWPIRSSGAGLFDLAGFPKTDFYHRASLWLDKPIVYLTANKLNGEQQGRGPYGGKASWNWQKGDKVRVNCITNSDEAELFLNQKSLGKIKKDKDGRFYWDVDFEPGELVVKGYKAGKVEATHTLKTAGEASRIVASSDIQTFNLGRKEVAHIEIELRDKDNNFVIEGSNEIKVDIEGDAKLLGLESGDLASHEDYKASARKTYNGRLLAYIETSGKPGVVNIRLSSPGLKPVVVRLRSKK